jgi:hypothetical protein
LVLRDFSERLLTLSPGRWPAEPEIVDGGDYKRQNFLVLAQVSIWSLRLKQAPFSPLSHLVFGNPFDGANETNGDG